MPPDVTLAIHRSHDGFESKKTPPDKEGSEKEEIGIHFRLWALRPPPKPSFMSETVASYVASEIVPFLRVALSWSKALMKLALVNRSRPSKALWCLAFAVPTFTAFGANDGTLGIVVKTAIRDPSLIQVYNVHLQLLCCVLTSVLFPASMPVLLLMFCLSLPELSMLCSLAVWPLIVWACVVCMKWNCSSFKKKKLTHIVNVVLHITKSCLA
ncbi:hypothetical protein GQ457_04G037880 [Hibiscus cannabinus]